MPQTEQFYQNIHIKEVEALLAYMKENEQETVALVTTPGGIGNILQVHKLHKPETVQNITNYDCW